MGQTKTKKISLVIPSLQAGGMERVMTELATYFSLKRDVEVHLILYGINRDIFYEVPENVRIYKPKFKFNNKFRLISTIRTLYYLRKSIKGIHPDTILSFGEYWNNFVLIATFGLKLPIYVSDRSQPNKSLGKFQDLLRKLLYPKSKGVILQTQKAKEIYQDNFNNLNIKVIGNPIREIKNLKNIKRVNQILMIGRLIESKHQDRLIKIFSKLNKPNWKLVLVGYDHLKQTNSINLEKLISKLNLSDSVVLAGKQSDVESYYLNSKIFAFTSSSEGFPNVIGEAMAAGLPVIAYDCIAGPSEMIKDDETGFLIPLFDDDTFGVKLAQLIDDEKMQKKMGASGKKKIKMFKKDLISEQFLEFIFSHDK